MDKMTEIPRVVTYLTSNMPDGHWIDQWNREVWIKDAGRHRPDGPAVIYQDGSVSWWLNDKYYTFDEWLKINIELTDSQKVLLKLKYG